MERFLRILTIGAVTRIISLVVGWFGHIIATREQGSEEAASARIGNVQNLRTSYERWKVWYEMNGGDRNLVLPLGWSKALSAEFTNAKGQAILDLVGGSVSVEVRGLPEEGSWEVWLVDNLPGPGRSVMPESSDAMVRVGSLHHEGGVGRTQAQFDDETFSNFDVDLVVISRDGQDPGEGGVLFGSPTLFQRLYTSARTGRFAVSDRFAGAPPPPMSGSVYASQLESVMAGLVANGEDIFFNEEFEGNGRTCGTCHRADNNLTIDPEFIATLPDDDPLFVAEFTDALNFDENGGLRFENPVLMREFGLIVENVDGFDLDGFAPLEVFVMRGVPHTLALSTSLTPAGPLFGPPAGPPFGGSTTPPNQRTGWSGDGAPGGGTLRDFATGAVTQHFPLTTERVAEVDFRLPNDAELDALEAFQLSLGRLGDPDPGVLGLKDPNASTGLGLFNGAGKCSACHFNAGATLFIAPGQNANFDTGVENVAHPADATGELRPRDGGFGKGGDLKDGFGNQTFNTPPLVEAADTPPFFHNNLIDTIEESVDFYNGKEFKKSPSGPAVGGISLTDQEVQQIGAFLRVMNALENVRSAIGCGESAKQLGKKPAQQLLALCTAEIEDAIEVLEGGPLKLHLDALDDLQEALDRISDAAAENSKNKRNELIDEAVAKLEDARSEMCAAGPNDALLCP